MKSPRPRRRRILFINLGAAAVFIALVAVVIAFAQSNSGERATSPGAANVVRENSHRLDTAADGKVTLVEFLDFECEACGAAYPFIEQLRKDYAGQVTFITRYFPIPSHANAQNAALAAEAASRQGAFEPMYSQLFQTQSEWGEQQESRAELFREYAEELGLDMEQYDSDIRDPATSERIELDLDDGKRLGVQGTPTFFLNGEILTVSTSDEFTSAIDEALQE